MQTMSASSTTRPPSGPAMARQEWRQALAAFDAAMERYEKAIKAHARALEQCQHTMEKYIVAGRACVQAARAAGEVNLERARRAMEAHEEKEAAR